MLISPRQGRGGRAWFIANLARFVVVALAGIAAQRESALPLYVLAALSVGTLLVLHLRFYKIAGPAAIVAWSLIAVGVLVVSEMDLSGEDRVRLYLVASALVAAGAWAIFMARGSSILLRKQDLPDEVGREAAIGVVISLGSGPAALLLWLIVDRLDVPSVVRTWLLGAAVGGPVGAVMVAAIASAFRSYRKIDNHVPRHFPRHDPPTTLDLARGPRAALKAALSSTRDRAGNFEVFGLRLQVAVAASASALGDVLRSAANRVVNAIIELREVVRRARIIAGRRFRKTVEYSMKCLSEGTALLAKVAVRFFRGVLLPLVAFVVAANAAWSLASHLVGYLNTGPVRDALISVLMGFVVTTCQFLVWAAWSGYAPREALDVQLRTVGIFASDGLLLFVAVGWTLGIAGLLGFGPIRPGPATIGATIILLAVMAHAMVLNRRRRLDPRSGGAH